MRSPSFLKSRDKVAIIPPAKAIDWSCIEEACRILERWGLQVVLSDNIQSKYFQFAGRDYERQSSFQKLLDDPDIKCIFCARGGYGTTRIVDQLNLGEYLKYPKWIVGYSDITVLLSKSYNLGIQGIHGPMPLNWTEKDSEESLDRLNLFLFKGEFPAIIVPPNPANKPGTADGTIIGGNLTMLINSLSTSSDIDTEGSILFLEDVDEYLYRIDRMVVQLKRTGKLEKIKGLIIGHFTRMRDNDAPFGNTIEEIFVNNLKDYSFPVCFNAPVGHEMPNFPIPIGGKIQLSVDKDISTISSEK